MPPIPLPVTIAALRSPSGQNLGLADVRNRISEIQRRMGVSAGWAGAQWTAPTTSSVAATGTGSFQDMLARADGSAAAPKSGQAVQSQLDAAAAAVMSAGQEAAANSALLESLGAAPIVAAKPASMPGVAVTDTMRAAGNGRLPDSMLSSIGSGEHRLSKPAAEGFVRMVNAARRDGVTFGVNDSYRSYSEQVDIANRLGLYSQGGLAAAPGTSNHGWGLALDLDLDDKAQAWMGENAWKYGYYEDVPGESWHWTYREA